LAFLFVSDLLEDEGNLAYAASDGSIGLIKIKQKLVQRNNSYFTPRHDIEVDMEHVSHLVYESENNAGVTSLTWVRIPGRSVRLRLIVVLYTYICRSPF
jgi:hypothetical protein